ncbi:insulin-like peptide INSL5 [Octodon degus]|uniref:Insulin-like peptide INSL5 n=1 Tax=Octodon degus TaxID=10160 RepID=A0A6P3F827_OCTDE|nr:insulin-like peptide INSL5 [Octodon degus]
MKGSALTPLLLCVLFATSEVRSKDTVRLCGLDYVRTVVYICATARWRRQAEGTPPDLRAEKKNYIQLRNRHEASEDSLARNLAEVDFSGEELVRDRQTSEGAPRGTEKHVVVSRRDLQTVCCTEGCSMAELSALC